MSKRFTEGIAFDGTAILDNGKPITITEILNNLNRLDRVERELKKLRVGDVIKNEVAVCDNEWHESNMQHFGECHACGLKAEY